MKAKDKKLIRAYDKEMAERLRLYFLISKLPFSYNRPGKIVGMEKEPTKAEIAKERARMRRRYTA